MMMVAYALGVFAPAVAFARADRDAIIHVLSESHDGMITVHFHDDRATGRIIRRNLGTMPPIIVAGWSRLRV